MHLHRGGFPVPDDPLEAEAFAANRPPAATGLPHPKGVVRAKSIPHRTAVHRVDKIEHDPLEFTLHFFEVRPHHV